MGYISTWVGDRFNALLVSLMVLQRVLEDRNPLRPCFNKNKAVNGHTKPEVTSLILNAIE